MFCFHNLDTDEEVNLDQTKKRGKRSLNMTNYTNIDITQETDNSYLKNEGLSDGSYSPSPSSGYVSSPEHVPSPPMFKKIKQDTSEVLIPTIVGELFNPPRGFASTTTAFGKKGTKLTFSLSDVPENL